MDITLIEYKLIEFSMESNEINDDIQKNFRTMPVEDLVHKGDKIKELSLRIELLADVYKNHRYDVV